MRIRGQQLYVFTGSDNDLTPIGCSTDCSLDLAADVVEGSRVGSTRRKRSGLCSWNASCRGFAVEGVDFDLVKNLGQPITVAFSVLRAELVARGVELSAISPDDTATLVGRAVVTGIRYVGGKPGLATAEVQFTGTGELGELVEKDGFTYIFPIVF